MPERFKGEIPHQERKTEISEKARKEAVEALDETEKMIKYCKDNQVDPSKFEEQRDQIKFLLETGELPMDFPWGCFGLASPYHNKNQT
jgi:hypothetical protein